MIEQLLAYNTIVVLLGVSILGAGAGLVGSFAVLRKRALTGDAVAHAALPGVCVAFLILGERNLTFMLLGALASGVLGIVIISALCRWTRVREDAAIGIVLSLFPGLGFALSRIIQNVVTSGSKAGLESFILGKTAGMTRPDVYLILAASLFCLTVVLVLYKEFKVVAFDTGFAQSLGWPVYWLDLLLMSLIAVAVVIGLPAVGIIMMAALLILPGAAARFWTDSLSWLLFVAGAFGLITGLVGTVFSALFAMLPAGPIIVLTGSIIFLASMLFGIRRGAFARLLEHWRFQREYNERQLLLATYDVASRTGQPRVSTTDLLSRKSWSPAQLNRLISAAGTDGFIERIQGDEISFTPSGLNRAVEVTRGQRLWEELLTEYPDLAGSVANLASESVDQYVEPAIVAELTARLQEQSRWPLLPTDVEAAAGTPPHSTLSRKCNRPLLAFKLPSQQVDFHPTGSSPLFTSLSCFSSLASGSAI
ncbi:MAG: metal ABC transporter permease [Planctomycetales bacterium]|nr:metal ABC transporter permease [Planctomycetales bacterium]